VTISASSSSAFSCIETWKLNHMVLALNGQCHKSVDQICILNIVINGLDQKIRFQQFDLDNYSVLLVCEKSKFLRGIKI
jgi:hypothetical protein